MIHPANAWSSLYLFTKYSLVVGQFNKEGKNTLNESSSILVMSILYRKLLKNSNHFISEVLEYSFLDFQGSNFRISLSNSLQWGIIGLLKKSLSSYSKISSGIISESFFNTRLSWTLPSIFLFILL